MRTFFGVASTIVAILSFAIGAVGVGEVVTGVADGATWGAMIFLFGTGSLAAVGARRAFKGPVDRAALPAGDPVSTVLALAAAEGGRVTVAEIAAKTPLDITRAREVLDELVRQDMAGAIVTEEGVEVFRIKGLLGPAEKAAARDILDA